jgi:hypothetical protein
MSKHIPFVDRVLAGDVLRPRQAIDAEVEAWHRSDSRQSLSAWLGLTEAEYAAWVDCAANLRVILKARMHKIPFIRIQAGDPQPLALAARGLKSADRQRVLDWVKKQTHGD